MLDQSELKLPQRTSKDVRTIYFLDIENLCGMSNPSVKAILHAKRLLNTLMLKVADTDFYVIGCDPSNFLNVDKVFHQRNATGKLIRIVASYRGKDGGDRALSFYIKKYFLARSEATKWDRIVVASGDGYFSEVSKKLANSHSNLYLISRNRKSTSAELAKIFWSRKRLYFEDIHPNILNLDEIRTAQLNKEIKKYHSEHFKKLRKKPKVF